MKLDELALKHGTDKASAIHNYTRYYEQYFEPLRDKPLRILEIGIATGASLRMWREYFPNAEIIGLDKDEAYMTKEGVITIKGDQSNKRHLLQVAELYTPFDIIIDDGSHINKDLLLTFETLFVALKSGGLYVAEDLHTCYWGFGFGRPKFIKRLKTLIDQVNSGGKAGIADRAKESPLGFMRWPMTWWERNVEFVHFYRGIVFIKKV